MPPLTVELSFFQTSPVSLPANYLPVHPHLDCFAGNRFMTSLGNIEATPLASLTFIDFVTGDILYLTGLAQNFFGSAARNIMPFQNALTTVHVSGYILVHDALPLRQRKGTSPQPRYLFLFHTWFILLIVNSIKPIQPP